MTSAIVFDLDGTLIDSAPDLHHASNRLLAEQGAEPLTLEQVRSFIGNGTPMLVERVLRARDLPHEAEVHAVAHTRFMDLYMEDPSGRTTVFAGVTEALTALRDAGHRLAVCTNKPEAPTHAVLATFGLASFMEAVVGGDTLPVIKPDPAPLREALRLLSAETGLFIGDSEVDAGTAQNAALPFGLFTEGYRKTPVEKMTKTFTFDAFADLPDLVSLLSQRA